MGTDSTDGSNHLGDYVFLIRGIRAHPWFNSPITGRASSNDFVRYNGDVGRRIFNTLSTISLLAWAAAAIVRIGLTWHVKSNPFHLYFQCRVFWFGHRMVEGSWRPIEFIWGKTAGWLPIAPYTLCLITLGMLPVAWLIVMLRPRRIDPGICAACGYDLRATQERCPECGQVPVPSDA